jgi:hypothetical protein
MSNSPPYDPNQPQYGSMPPYDPNQQPQYGSPQPTPKWNAPAAPGYPQPGTFDPQAGAYAPQSGAFDPQSGAYAPQPGAFNPQTGGYGQQRPAKSRTGLWIAIGAAVLLLVCVLCGGVGWWVIAQSDTGETPTGAAATSAGPAGAHRIRYEVTGSGQAVVTWSKADTAGGVEQQTVTLPWSAEVGTDRGILGLTLLANIRGDGSLGECRIHVDGKELTREAAPAAGRLLTCIAIYSE